MESTTGMLENSIRLAEKARGLGATITLTPITFADGYNAIPKQTYGILKGIVDAGACRKGPGARKS